MKYTLPLPPTVNSAWIHHGHRKIISKKYAEFKHLVWAEWLQSGRPSYHGRLSLCITIHMRDKRKSDLDNRLKACLDAMQHAGFFADDEQIDELIVRRGEIIKGGKCIVEIRVLHEGSIAV